MFYLRGLPAEANEKIRVFCGPYLRSGVGTGLCHELRDPQTGIGGKDREIFYDLRFGTYPYRQLRDQRRQVATYTCLGARDQAYRFHRTGVPLPIERDCCVQ